MEFGRLYVVPTPIGNLKDITLRALEVLEFADIIAAEDTRQSLKLLNHFNIKKPLVSYHKFNEQSKSENIINLLKEGKNIALISDAGMPGISDPGSVIISKCIEENIDFIVLPGATATITALVYSGLDTTKFIFRGFFPRETKDRKNLIRDIEQREETLILYEAPHRLTDSLEFIMNNLGNRNVAVCREITKLHEEIFRGTMAEAYKHFNEKTIKGEIVLVIQGKTQQEIIEEKRSGWENISIEDHIVSFINMGKSKKEAIKMVSIERGMPKSEIYKHSLNIE
ncbi:MAG: 16S rRNA (cytidine(1402)-2'-O)-methyltransferase [Solirubrobacterales bacterium]